MVLGKIIAGAKLLTALSGQPDTTAVQDSVQINKEIVLEENVETYGTIRNETTITLDGVTRQVNRVNTDKFSMNYATYPGQKNTDVLEMNLTLPKGYSIGFVKLDEGENDQHILHINKNIKLGNWNTNLSYGKGLDKDEYQWLIGSADNGQFYMLASTINEGPILKDESFETLFSGAASATLGNFYVGVGAQGFDEKLKPRGVIAYSNENFGSATLLMYNPNNKGWFFKTQTATGNIAEGFYNRDTYNTFFLAETTAGPFIPNRFGTSVAKGNYTLGIWGNGNDEEANFTVMPGMRTKVADIGVGVRTKTKDGKTEANVSAIVNKEFEIGKNISGYVDAQYDAVDNSFGVYATISYTLTK